MVAHFVVMLQKKLPYLFSYLCLCATHANKLTVYANKLNILPHCVNKNMLKLLVPIVLRYML